MVRAAALAPRLTIMAYLSQPWFNREIVNRFAMATGVVHSETLTVITRASKQPQKIPVTPVEVDGVKYRCPPVVSPSG